MRNFTHAVTTVSLLALVLSGCGDRASFKAIGGKGSNSANPSNGDADALPGVDGGGGGQPGSTDPSTTDTSTNTDGTTTDNGGADGAGTDGSTDETPTDKVEKACSTGTKVTFSQDVAFAKPKATCAWGQDGNRVFNAADDLIITARREENVELSLPVGARLCDMTYEFPTQTMRYDDEIMLNLNGVVMAASQGYNQANELETKDGFLIYDWTKIVGDTYPRSARPPYFVDQDCADCVVPPTQTTGTMKLTVKPETVKRLSAYTGGIWGTALTDGKHTFTFVTTGDNNPADDCMHDDFQFTVRGTYVE